MNFQDLYKKIAEIDRRPVSECGDMPPMMGQPNGQPVTMSVSLNAQGEENISSLMRLLTKVNPDMMPKTGAAMPAVSPELSIGGPGPRVSSAYDDKSEDMLTPSPRIRPSSIKNLDRDGDGDHDMQDHELERHKEESFQDATTEPDEQYKDIDFMNNKLAGGMNRPKNTYPRVANGDNPMQRIKEELTAALALYKSK
jgi:hypothetical protein